MGSVSEVKTTEEQWHILQQFHDNRTGDDQTGKKTPSNIQVASKEVQAQFFDIPGKFYSVLLLL